MGHGAGQPISQMHMLSGRLCGPWQPGPLLLRWPLKLSNLNQLRLSSDDLLLCALLQWRDVEQR